MNAATKEKIKRAIGPAWTVRLRCLASGKPLPRWGNLRRIRPFSEFFGADRGAAVDRHYLKKFLESHREQITGDVLEIQMPGYTNQYGHDLRKTDTVDIDPRHKPTYVCDLAQSEGIVPSDAYDCFLLPNTLCALRDIEGCLRQALRVVKPGGVILATTAGFMPLMADNPDYWRMSAAGWAEVARRAWPGCEMKINGHGNCLAAVAGMLGLSLEELTPEELDANDPRYPVLVTLFCRKPPR